MINALDFNNVLHTCICTCSTYKMYMYVLYQSVCIINIHVRYSFVYIVYMYNCIKTVKVLMTVACTCTSCTKLLRMLY